MADAMMKVENQRSIISLFSMSDADPEVQKQFL